MNATQRIKALARGIREYKGVISERDRSRFARIVRDACQLENAWPGEKVFDAWCEIDRSKINEGS